MCSGAGGHSSERIRRRARSSRRLASSEDALALQGTGKRGGARVIYYYHNERLPVFLISVYAKNRKANLSKAARNAMKRLVPALVAGYPGKA
jgi:hypothetical protein